MDADQPGLFELPDRELQIPLERAQRGRNREVWGLTATADVTITEFAGERIQIAAVQRLEHVAVADGRAFQPDAPALQAAARAIDGFGIAVPGAGLGDEDTEPEAPVAVPGDDVFDALAWLIWPSDGLEEALDAGALRILSVDSEAKGDSIEHGTATWRVTVKLTDVDELRRIAARASPDQAAEISASLAVAGITWKPGRVVVEHLPARAARNH